MNTLMTDAELATDVALSRLLDRHIEACWSWIESEQLPLTESAAKATVELVTALAIYRKER